MKHLNTLCPAISEECNNWLMEIGYYNAPASLKFHGTEEGDLFNHSYQVAEELVKFTMLLDLKWQRKESPMIVGLLHDVCKCDDYVKIDGVWQYNKDKIMAGHGDKSLIMLSGHISLTEEETYCIRYHMGAYTDKEEWPYYGKAVEKFPNVLYTHTADMIASKIKGI